MTTRRPVVIALLILAIVGLFVAAREPRAGDGFDLGPPVASPAAQLAPPGTSDSTWYCVGGTATGGAAALSVVVANIGETPRQGVITWYPSEGTPVVTDLRIEGYRSATFPVPGEVTGPYVSATVELDGGDVAVEHAVAGPRGANAAPCASGPSPNWFFANGSTARDASQVLMVFNPFPADAVIDVTFATNEGNDAPTPLQGLPVAPRSMKAIDLGERRRDLTATSVRARTGQVVVERLQSFDGSADRMGLSLEPAASGPATIWRFPRGFYDAVTSERWHIYNPGDREAQVSIEITPDDPALLPEPIDLVIPPESRTTVDAAEQARVPAGAGYSSQVRSLNGVPIVAEREVNGRSPSPPRGWSSALGAPRAAPRWVFPVGESSDAMHEGLVVHNPGRSGVRFSVFTLADGVKSELSALQDQELKPGARVSVGLLDVIRLASLPLIVEASGPVVVERQMSSMGGGGSSWVMGVPSPERPDG